MSEHTLSHSHPKATPWTPIGTIGYDPVFLVTQKFRELSKPVLPTGPEGLEAALGDFKVGLTIGQPVHLESGKPLLLPSVKAAFHSFLRSLESGQDDTGYREPAGDPAFRSALTRYVLDETGPTSALPPVACIQTVGGTNAVRRALEFVRAKVPGFRGVLHAPQDRWVGHNGIAKALGIAIADYPVMNSETAALDGDRMLSALEALPERSLVCFSFENPAGLVPSEALTSALQDLALEKGFMALFDIAYHGLMRGPQADTQIIRSFMRAGVPTIVAYSAGKAFTMTGARVGALLVQANDHEHLSQIQDYVGHELNRPDFTHASILGAHVLRHVLTNPTLRQQHMDELAALRVALDQRGAYFLAQLREYGLPSKFALPEQSRGLFRPLPWLGAARIQALQALGIYTLDTRVTTMAPEAWLHYAARGIVHVCRTVEEPLPRETQPFKAATLPRPPYSFGDGGGPLGLGGC